jgi:hypothetical protein
MLRQARNKFQIPSTKSQYSMTKTVGSIKMMLLPQSGRPQEAPWKEAGLSSHQLKSEIKRWDTDLHRFAQIS